MNWLQRLQLRLRALFQKQRLDEQMDEEMRSHLEMQTEENIDAGMKPEEPRYAALRKFGWVESIKDTCREQSGVSWIENWGQDIRFGARMLSKNPGFTLGAVLRLALGIGAKTAIFSLIDHWMLRFLQVRNPQELLVPPGICPYPRHERLRGFNQLRQAGNKVKALQRLLICSFSSKASAVKRVTDN